MTQLITSLAILLACLGCLLLIARASARRICSSIPEKGAGETERYKLAIVRACTASACLALTTSLTSQFFLPGWDFLTEGLDFLYSGPVRFTFVLSRAELLVWIASLVLSATAIIVITKLPPRMKARALLWTIIEFSATTAGAIPWATLNLRVLGSFIAGSEPL